MSPVSHDLRNMNSTVTEKINAGLTGAKTDSASKIRAGIVGAGLMGRWHADALEKAGGDVLGVVDSDICRTDSFAANFPNVHRERELIKLLAARNLDVLHVCSPTPSHVQIAETALKEGIHLLIEKPIAQTSDETVKLYDLASRHGALLCPVHQFVFQEGTVKAKKLLPRIGDLVHLEARICSAGGIRLNTEWLDETAADILPHPLSLIQNFLGSDFSDIDWSVLRPSHGELRVHGQIGEKSLAIFISMNSRPTTNSFHLVGTGGTIHLDLFHGFSIYEPGKTSRTRKILHPFDLAFRNVSAAAFNLGRRTLRREPAYPGLRQLIQKFYSAVKGGTESPITSAEAIAVAEIRDLLMDRAGIASARRP